MMDVTRNMPCRGIFHHPGPHFGGCFGCVAPPMNVVLCCVWRGSLEGGRVDRRTDRKRGLYTLSEGLGWDRDRCVEGSLFCYAWIPYIKCQAGSVARDEFDKERRNTVETKVRVLFLP